MSFILNIKNNASHQYVDVDVFNNSMVLRAQPLIFNQIKSQNVLDNCSGYYFSVIRWCADSVVPVIIPDMQLNMGIDDFFFGKTTYYFNMAYGVDPETAALINSSPSSSERGSCLFFVPDIRNTSMYPNYAVPLRLPKSQVDVISNPYFWLSSVDSFLNMCNKSISVLFARAKILYPTELVNATCPMLKWNASLNKIDLFVGMEFIQFDGTGNKFWISMNTPLYNLFSTFNVIVSKRYDVENFRDGIPFFLDLPFNVGMEQVVVPDGAPVAKHVYRFTQEYSTVPCWSPCSSIVFSSYTIPVNVTQSGAPNFYGNNPYSNQNSNNLSNTITDFEIQLKDGLELSNNVLFYTPSAEYRLFDLMSSQPLNQLNIQVFWKSKFGSYIPFYLKYGGSASMKLMMRTKDFEGGVTKG